MRPWRLVCVVVVLLIAGHARAQLPTLAMDISVGVRVEPDRRLLPGEAGKLFIAYRNRGPDTSISLIASSNYFESFHARESIRFVLQDTPDECPVLIDYPFAPNPQDRHHFGTILIFFGAQPAGATGECTMAFRVGADPEPFPLLEFEIGEGQAHLADPRTQDNRASVQLLFHQADHRVVPIPSIGFATGSLLLAAVLAAATRARRRRRRA
jgi:hypothetical protein